MSGPVSSIGRAFGTNHETSTLFQEQPFVSQKMNVATRAQLTFQKLTSQTKIQ